MVSIEKTHGGACGDNLDNLRESLESNLDEQSANLSFRSTERDNYFGHQNQHQRHSLLSTLHTLCSILSLSTFRWIDFEGNELAPHPFAQPESAIGGFEMIASF